MGSTGEEEEFLGRGNSMHEGQGRESGTFKDLKGNYCDWREGTRGRDVGMGGGGEAGQGLE